MAYPNTGLQIGGTWIAAEARAALPVVNPATGAVIGAVAKATADDLDHALAAAKRGFAAWRAVSALERGLILRRAAELLRARVETIARLMTLEQGKPLREARVETLAAADTLDWFAEEGRRAYGRVIPARAEGVMQTVIREPVGPVAAFTPWNFPLNQAVRKVAAALCVGCSVILKGPEDTPASCAALVQALLDAGVPGEALGLLYGDPAPISAYLIAAPEIAKISFTGSTAVGKLLATLAGTHMKRVTMELGGHAPAIVCADADLERAVEILAANKFRNAGQVCVAPTRFLVERPVYEDFVERFAARAAAITVGDGLDEATQMGPLIHERRRRALEELIAEAEAAGGRIVTGGSRPHNQGFFLAPTVLTEVPTSARILNEEPFGPVATVAAFSDLDEALAEANRLPFGLAAYAYTRSSRTASRLGSGLACGMLGINHHGLGLPETPFGGVGDSGYGSEGGPEALEGYLATKFITMAA
ncbi:NAD-dependent succinate-semialdehyde dehydrogenase [Methylobacterium organophilum]|uniref:Alpha-ketoglutaric semialdehyde dehydrogenase 1 n=1 Tax=Methylobacterium organophilum TaxID=410 RepID=A0ABQ4TAP4_METOR|nr:NAD-dependent succinate-semialdehyde dehydrogenase [Methylobacterium organophilum]GJE27679.1 Alpha-ketoglutaric semialdehyde dehydrogenase 1 [Methylobacterium organophilum]